MFFGFDFYIYSSRLLIKGNKSEIFILKNGLVFYAFSYILLFFSLKFIFDAYFNKLAPFYLIYILIVFEHLGQEFFRIYIALKKTLLANILLFVRTGLWSLIIVFMIILNYQISIFLILIIWLFCAIFTCVLGFAFYPKINLFFKSRIDFNWIKKGLIVGLTMFVSTIFLKLIEFSDRFLIDYFYSKQEVGIYAFYFQLANIANVVIFTLYISFLYPDLIKGVYTKSYDDVKAIQKTIRTKAIVISGLFLVVFLVFSPLLLDYIDRVELNNFKIIFFILLLSNLLLNISYTSHYYIIGAEREGLIFKSTFIACLVNIVLNIILLPMIGILGSALAILFSNLVLLLLKKKFENRLIKL